MLLGNSFHNDGSLALNDFDAKVCWLVLGTWSTFEKVRGPESLSEHLLLSQQVLQIFWSISMKAFVHKQNNFEFNPVKASGAAF